MKGIQIKIRDKIAGQQKSNLFILFTLAGVFAALVTTSGCSKHYATATTSDKSVTTQAVKASTVSTPSLSDSLIGTWKIRTTEVEQAVDKMTSFGSQTAREEMLAKQKQYQESFMGLTTTFKSDKTFQSIFSGQSDVGTWQVSSKNEIETMSRVTGNATSFDVVSLNAGVLIVKYATPEMVLLLTFAKQ